MESNLPNQFCLPKSLRPRACVQGFHSCAQAPMDDKAVHQREENAKIHLGSRGCFEKDGSSGDPHKLTVGGRN